MIDYKSQILDRHNSNCNEMNRSQHQSFSKYVLLSVYDFTDRLNIEHTAYNTQECIGY